MRIATWNINSVRLRLSQVLRVLEEYDFDVLCLQETKTQDVSFPANEIAEAGWPYQAIRGEKSYNGVA
ncbi:MAG: exodeoxyribonuclease III, partial [Alphaproteobacteria bacterium]|nr:exodeoxyribonuclease III [Alphaproteobacteria bacterium]